MKLEIDNRYDSKGFWFRTKLITVSFHFWELTRGKLQSGPNGKVWKNLRPHYGWCFKTSFGRGAGYVWGRTAFLGWRSKGGIPYNAGKPLSFRFNGKGTGKLIAAGFTQWQDSSHQKDSGAFPVWLERSQGSCGRNIRPRVES